ncbi:phosphatase PAP2 family protein [Pseudolysinimonas sp.]|uniref:phosphatase PAP2 family protein n=1 Tax=Pseudolysinimonas sp. TaxID=2680009 RepID=UPI003F7FA9CA
MPITEPSNPASGPRRADVHRAVAVPALRPRVIVAIIGVVLVAAGGIALRTSSFDLPVDRALNTAHTGAIGALGDAVYRFVGPVPAIIGTAVLTAILLLVRRDLRVAAGFAVTIAVTWLSSAVVKIAVARPRPDPSLLPHPSPAQTDASYPSGHAVFITALVVTAVLVTRSPALRRVWAIVGGLAVIGVGVLLVSDGVHFPTDVLASWIWSLSLAPLVAAVWVLIVRPRGAGPRRREARAG